MGKYIYFLIGLFIISLLGGLSIQRNKIKELSKLSKQQQASLLAYQAQNSDLKDKNYEFQVTIDDLKQSIDSIDRKLLKAVDDIGIKLKRISNLQYQTNVIEKHDTIFMDSVIFVNNINIDTTLQDDWYRLQLGLHYPNKIYVNPQFKSEKYVVTHTEKEYVKPRSKWWIKRIFQKRHSVTTIDIYEKSPYIKEGQFKQLKITK